MAETAIAGSVHESPVRMERMRNSWKNRAPNNMMCTHDRVIYN